MKEKMTLAEAGRLGGQATFKNHGREYMANIGKKGAETLHRRYQIIPLRQTEYALVHRTTRKIRATW